MPPEYACEGFFSIKSDVFSFGVVVLEIVSGIRNSRMAVFEEGLSLLGHVCINILLLLLHKSLIYQKPLLMNTLYIIFFFRKLKNIN